MEGIKDFRRFQLGREARNNGAPGTVTPATAIMRGQWIGADNTQIVYPDENIGNILETTRGYIPYVLGSIRQGPDALTFEQFPYILAAAIRGIERGAADGVGSGRIYHYPWPRLSSDSEYRAITLSFTAASRTVADSANGLGFIRPGDMIRITGAGQAGNNNFFRVATAAAGSVVVDETLVNESAGATVTIDIVPQAYTVEGGNNVRVDRSTWAYPVSFELSGSGGANADAVMLTSAWNTRQWARVPTGFTPGIALPAVREALFSRSRLFIDNVGGTLGTTERTNTLSAFTYRANTGLRHQFSGSGNLFYGRVERQARIQLTCAITLYQNDAGLAEYDAWLANTTRLLRIRIEGAALTTPGTLYSNRTILLDMPGTWVSFPNLEDLEGAEVLPGQFRPAFDPAAGIGPSITVVNELASLP